MLNRFILVGCSGAVSDFLYIMRDIFYWVRRRFRVVFQTHFKYDHDTVSYSKYLKNGTCSRISRLNNYLNKISLIICISLAYIESLISATVSSITLYASLASSTFPVSNRLSGYTRLLTANRILSSGCCA